MDYSKLSDFEINSAVFEALHGGAPDYKEGEGGSMILLSFEGDVIGGDAVELEVERGCFNPCNNPADAWPIIDENEISLIPSNYGSGWVALSGLTVSEFSTYIDEGLNDCFKHEDTNGLRAAMIVFLMMQESANVQDNPA